MHTTLFKIQRLAGNVALWVCLALVGTAMIAQAAFAGGEPKNQAPLRAAGRRPHHAERDPAGAGGVDPAGRVEEPASLHPDRRAAVCLRRVRVPRRQVPAPHLVSLRQAPRAA